MDYIEFDEFGLKELRCMNCKHQIAGRTYIELPSRTDPSKKVNVLAMTRFSNHAQVRVDLSDGTYADIPVCSMCTSSVLDLDGISKQLLIGWEKEMFFANKSRFDVAQMKKRCRRLRVVGRAE